MAEVELRGVAKVYPGGIEALAGIDLKVHDGEFLAIVGPSGSGKSTALRIVAGLEEPTGGEVWIGGRRADGLPPRDRDAAMVFQSPALFPHLTVFDNLAFGLRARGMARTAIRPRVEEAAALLGLSGELSRRPAALSGGQRQRAALGRAVVRGAGLVLLDEPLVSLDAPLRSALRAELVALHRRTGPTMILVTHDQGEAMALGDRVAVLIAGRLVQVGAPLEVYRRPATVAVAGFIGDPPMNLLPCAVEHGGPTIHIRLDGTDPESSLSTSGEPAWAAPLRGRAPGPVVSGLRAEHIRTAEGEAGPDGLRAVGEVRRLEPRGHETLATLRLGPGERDLVVRLAPDARVRIGEPLPVVLDLAEAVWFDAATGAILEAGR